MRRGIILRPSEKNRRRNPDDRSGCILREFHSRPQHPDFPKGNKPNLQWGAREMSLKLPCEWSAVFKVRHSIFRK